MRRLIVPLFLITSALSLADQGGFGGPIHLTGLNGFPTNSAGAWHTGWYNTFGSPSDPGKNAYVIAGSSVLGNFLNSGNATPTMIDVDISAPGRYQFCALFEGNEIYAGRDFWGLNLFFNGQNVLPKISAYSAPNTGAALSPPTFQADSNNTLSLDASQTVLGSGVLSFAMNGKTVRLTEYCTNTVNVFGVDRVNNFALGLSGRTDHVTQFTLEVVPEPAAVVGLGLGLGLLLRRRRVTS